MTQAAAALALSLALGFAACGDDADAPGAGISGTVTVLAASSLTEAFEELAREFEDEQPGGSVELSFAASSELATQIEQGAPADVFASADETTMTKLVDSGDIAGEPAVFARNRLAIAVERRNPEGIEALDDLGRDDLVVVLCASQVPCGRFADQALEAAGVSVEPASRAENVKAALTPVELGEADAAIVYVTDLQATDAAEAVEIPDAENVVARYPIAVAAEAGDPTTADAFVAFVLSDRGREVLRRFGFLDA